MAMTPQEAAAVLRQELQKEREKSMRLEADIHALASEFKNAGSVDEARETANTFIKETALPIALAQIKHLITNADSEAVRANLAKWAVDIVLTGKVDPDSNDTLGKLLKEINKRPANT